MERVIIGIHGLSNKPPAPVLRDWWILSIHDGMASIGLPKIPFRFELLYWADLFYPQPLDVTITDSKDTRYITHPYKKLAPPLNSKISLRKQRSRRRLEQIEDQLLKNDRVLRSFEELADQLIKLRFSDLDGYLNNKTGYGDAVDRPVRDVILERLGNLLLKHQNSKIMIIAHSMGTIIAYDLLMQPDSFFHADILMTLGSPLGQPTLADKFAFENPVLTKLKTPEGVDKWINHADLNDIIALDPTLGDDYAPNSRGVLPEDIFIDNRYIWEGSKNPHAIYGYLQTPAVAQRIYDFLMMDRSRLSKAILRKQAWFNENILKASERRRQQSPSRPEVLRKHKIIRSKTEEFDYQAST